MNAVKAPTNLAEIQDAKAEIEMANAAAAAAATPTAPTAAQPAAPVAATPAAPREVVIDGQTLTIDQIREMRANLATIKQREDGLAHREQVFAETRRLLDVSLQDFMAERTPAQTNAVYSPALSPAPAATPLLDALEPLARSVSGLERRAVLQDLHNRHGDFDEQALAEVLNAHPTLPPDTALATLVGSQTLQKQAAEAGATAARRMAEAGRTEPGAGDGVVTTVPFNPATASWDDTRKLAVSEAQRRGGVLVRP